MYNKQEMLRKIDREIQDIPPIPENIEQIKTLISNPRSDIHDIGHLVKRDPALTADILRIANSARYMTRIRAETVDRAITIIGLKELYAVIMRIAATKILEEQFSSMEEIWEHSVRCAFYAQHIAKIKKLTYLKEISYTAALLHDIGKLVLLTVLPGVTERINSLSESKDIAPSNIEKIALGLTHAEIGAKITEKWNFPDILVNSIAYHHAPILCNDEDKPLVFTVYLANTLCYHQELPPDLMLRMEPKVLEFFNIDNEEVLESILYSLILNFEEAEGNIV